MNRLLVVTDHLHEYEMLERALDLVKDDPFQLINRRTAFGAVDRLEVGDIAAIVLDLMLPDSKGVETFDRMFTAWPHTPVMVLSSVADESLAIEAMQRGAQGYVLKGDIESKLLPLALRSVIRSRTAEDAYQNERARAVIALNSISDAVICTDTAGKIDYMNVAAEKITGWSREEARGHPVSEVFKLINGISGLPEPDPVQLVLDRDESMGLLTSTLLVRRDGSKAAIEDSCSPIHDRTGKLTGVVIVFHDVTAAHAMTIKMAYLAQHDFLTKLPNRLLLNDRIAQAISLAKRNGRRLAVLFLDLDNFKSINDTLGHETGDRLLEAIAQRLSSCVRESDTVSRQGGDEFVVLLSEGAERETTALTATKIIDALRAPYAISMQEVRATTSIGISFYPEHGQDAETLIKNADTAMYHAKEQGRDNYQFFEGDMNAREVERGTIGTSLRSALEKEEFFLEYQPKINLSTGAITGAEALLRWNHPLLGLISPARFIPVAEEYGLIVSIGQWVLREACTQARRWLDAGLPLGAMAINISALELRQATFPSDLRKILRDTGLPPSALQLEITESVLMHDADQNCAILKELKSIGVGLAVDDFGTGYSSLSYLTLFPIDILKIDRAFVNDDQRTLHAGVIAKAIIGMGNNLNLKVVAEGVENVTQLAFLKELSCEEGQGFYFSLPIGAEHFGRLLATGVSKKAA
jgi:diguanylate cyclase (GGDEF)-like protein/PAS domain S-box-containing protein